MKRGLYSIALIAVGILFGLLIHSQYDDYKAELAENEQYRQHIETLKSAEKTTCFISEDLEQCNCTTRNPTAIIKLPVEVCWKHVDKDDIETHFTIAE